MLATQENPTPRGGGTSGLGLASRHIYDFTALVEIHYHRYWYPSQGNKQIIRTYTLETGNFVPSFLAPLDA
jgi:hypothetical protein